VARLTGGPQCIRPAMEAAACQIPASLYLPIATGSMLRNTYPAHAVLLGMLSAAAATAGFAMPTDAFEEGRRRVLGGTSPAAATPPGQWTILAGYLKPFAGVRHTHYGVEAALRLRRHPEFSLEKLAAIRLQTYAEAAQYCGNRAPQTAIQAQFSLSYAIVAAFVLGDLGPNAYDNIADPVIRRLEQCVVVEVDQARIRRGARVSIACGGQSLAESVDDIAGDPAVPMTEDQVVGKFRCYVEPILGEGHAEALLRFFLEGDAAAPARACFTFGR
jgi:2-methylcitrate dehydratase PrpD